MADVQWYYARDDQQHGPVSVGELRQLAASGGLSAADLVWREGMDEWAPAGRLKGLFPGGKPAAILPADEVLAGSSFPATSPSAGSLGDGALPDAAVLERGSLSDPGSVIRRKVRPQPPSLSAVLMFVQAWLWATCVLIVLVGIVLFTIAFLRAKTAADSSAAGVVFLTYFAAAYVLARAGEKTCQLLLTYLHQRPR